MKRIKLPNQTILLALFLCMVGGSALWGEIIHYDKNGFSLIDLYQYILFHVIGIVGFLYFKNIAFSTIKPRYKLPSLLAILILIISMFLDERIWRESEMLNIQLNVVAILVLIFSFAGVLYDSKNNLNINLKKIVVFSASSCIFLYLTSGDIFYTILLGGTYLMIGIQYVQMDKSILNKKKSIMTLLSLILAIVLIIGIIGFLIPEYRDAALTLLNPESDPKGLGYAQLVVKKSLNYGKFLGESLLLGKTGLIIPLGVERLIGDYTYLFIIEKIGLMGAGTVLIILIIFYTSFIRISKCFKNDYLKVITGGILIFWIIQSLFNILMNIGFPSVNSYIPFISYSRTNILLDWCMMGIILNKSC